MTCAACGADAIGLLNGEPVCGSCAAMQSFAEGKAVYVVTDPAAVPRDFLEPNLPKIQDLVARLRRLHRDEDFYRRARRIQQSGGCRR